MKVYRCLDSHRVRGMCIKYSYYTAGDNEAYSKMLDRCKTLQSDSDEITDDGMLVIARDILIHSNIDKIMREYSCDVKAVLEMILFNLYNDCCITFVELDNSDI